MRGLTFLVSFSVIAAFPGSSLCLGQVTGAVIEARGAARPANANSTYLALRGALPGGDGVAVKEFNLERQGGEFHFEQGSFYFYGPVNGRVTGAVFLGKGRFALSPKDVREQHSLAQLTKSGVMSQEFSTVVLRFTDGTAEEIRKAGVEARGLLRMRRCRRGWSLRRGFARSCMKMWSCGCSKM
jgi:hypothetical protein